MGVILLYKGFSWPEIGSMEGKSDLFSDKLPFEGRLTLGTRAGGSSLPEPKTSGPVLVKPVTCIGLSSDRLRNRRVFGAVVSHWDGLLALGTGGGSLVSVKLLSKLLRREGITSDGLLVVGARGADEALWVLIFRCFSGAAGSRGWWDNCWVAGISTAFWRCNWLLALWPPCGVSISS